MDIDRSVKQWRKHGFLLLLLLFSFVSTAVRADDTPAMNDSSFYEISNAAQLKWFAGQVNAKNTGIKGMLTADIDLSTLDEEYWTPIGDGAEDANILFGGVFDGNNHVISGLKVRPCLQSGLFGYTNGATIRNVVIEQPELSSAVITVSRTNSFVGALCGNATKTTIVNCHVRNAVLVPKENADSRPLECVGGICGYFNYSQMSKCTASGYIESLGDYAGGIAALVHVSQIDTCRLLNTSKGASRVYAQKYAGGIAGDVRWRSAEVCLAGCTNDSATVNAADAATCGKIYGYEEFDSNQVITYNGYAELYTADNLKLFATYVNNGTDTHKAKLMRDINMSAAGNFTPIGTEDHPFDGEFDGQGHTIDSLTINNQEYAGLFGYVKDGAIKNLTLTNPSLTTQDNDYLGFIAGFITQNSGHATPVGYIENCHVKNGNLLRNAKGEPEFVGGIAGKADMSAAVRDCSFQGVIKAHENYIGGIIGQMNSGASIERCYITGASTVWGNNYVGGIVGNMEDTDTRMADCFADQSQGEITLHAESGNYSGMLCGKDNSGTSGSNNTYTEDNLQYKLTGKQISVGGNTAYETKITGVASAGKGTYYAIVDIGTSNDYFTTEIENLNGVEELYFWDNNSNIAGTEACGWINMKIDDYAFGSGFKALKMMYRVFAGTDHDVMLRPSDVRPAGDKMFANCPDAKVYVDAEYYNEFCNDSLWSKYKDHLVATTSMRGEDVNAEYGARYAYDRNRDNTASGVKVDNGSTYGSQQVHVIGADDSYLTASNENTLWIYQDIGQTYDYNTTKIWASSFKGKDNIKQVKFQEITKSADGASQAFNIVIGDSAFANCKNLAAFNVALYSDEDNDHVEFLHPSQMPIGKGVFAGSSNAKIYVPRDLVDEFKYDTQYGWAQYKDIIEAGDFGNNDYTEDGVIYSYFTSEDGQTYYTNSNNEEMEKIVASWNTMYANFAPGKVLEYNNSSTIKYMLASGIKPDKINDNDGVMRLYCDIGETYPNHYKTIALSGSGFQNQPSIKKIVFEDIVANNYNTVTDLTFIIPDNTFRGCENLKELNMFYYVTRGENNYNGIKPSQVFIGKNVFDGVDEDFRIVVLPEYYNDYITDANWSQYKDRIVAADYLPTDQEPVEIDDITYDYVSKSLNTMSTSEITKLQSSGFNWIIPAIFATSIATGFVTAIVPALGTFATLEAVAPAIVDITAPLYAAAELATLSGLVVTNRVDAANEQINSTAQNYLVNRVKKNYSRPATWKMNGLWVRTEQTKNVPNMYISKVDDSASNITIYNDPGEDSEDFRTIGIERTAFHNKTNLQRVHFQDRYGEHSESLNSMVLSLPDSCFAGCTNLELLDLIIYSGGDGFGRYNGLTPDNFIPYGDIFAGLDKTKIKIRVSREAYKEFIEDDYWKQYKDMYQVEDVTEKEKQDEWKCKYSLAFNNNTIPLRSQSQGHDIEHVYIYGPGKGLEKTGLAALINDFGEWNNYKLDFVKSKAFYGNSDLHTLDITDTHTNVADVYTDFDIALMDSAFANCPNFEDFNIIYQVTDGDNHTESISPSQITLADGVFDGCDKLRIKFCLDQESAFLSDTAWAKYKNKFRPCFFEPRDKKVSDILLHPYRFQTDLNSGTNFTHVDATRPNPEDLKSLFKGQEIRMFDEFRAFGCCGLKTVYNGMFADCTSLQSIILPDSITSIETDAFKNCSLLYSLAIPANVTSIQENAFTGSGIKEFTVKSAVPADIDAAKVFAGLDSTYVIYVNDSVVADYRTKWVAVADHINGLSQRHGLVVVKLTESGTLAKKLGLDYDYNESLFSDLHLYGNYARFDSLRVIGPIDGRDIGVIRYLGGRDAEYNTVTPGHLKYLDLYEAELKSDGHYEYNRAYFDNDKPNDVVQSWTNNYIRKDNEVSDFMFWGLDQLKTLILPKTATKIRVGAFEHCTNLQTLVVGDDMKEIATEWDESYVALSTPNKVALVMLGNSVPETDEDAFLASSGTHYGKGDGNLVDFVSDDSRFTAAIVPYDAVKSYSSDVAYTSTCDSLIVNFEDAELVKALKTNHVFSPLDLIRTTNIKGFFNGNTGIKKFNEFYYSTVTTLGDSTFTGMAGITEMTLPYALEKITEGAFKGCSSLQRINALGTRIPEIEDSVFASLPTDFVIMVNEGQEEAYRQAWPQYKNHIQGYREASVNIREITLTKPNTLADSLNAKITMEGDLVVAVGGNFNNVQGLKINGPIGGKDLALIRYLGGREPDWNNPVYVTSLKYLDLYDAELRADNYYFMLKGTNRCIENDNEVPKDMLWNCDNLETVIMPRTATKLEYEACYNMASLKRLVIGDNVTEIEDDALGDNRNLESIIFLCSSKPELDGDAFTDPTEGEVRKIEKIYVRQSLVYQYSRDEEFTTHANQITTGFEDVETFRAFGSKAIATEDDVPSITSIDGWFDNFPGLTNLKMLNKSKITNIGKNGVNKLKNLQQIALPSTLSTIADGAFQDNANLHWLDLSECNSLSNNIDKLGVNSEALVYIPKSFGESKQANVVYGKAGALQCAEYNLTDSHDYDVPKAFTAKKVTFEREYSAGEYSTLTLPFSASQKPSGFTLYALDTDSTRSGRMFFNPTSKLEANVPYVVKARKGGTIVVNEETAIPETPNHRTSVRANGYTMYGNLQTIAAKDANGQKMITMSDSTLWNIVSADSADIKPFSAYMLVNNSTVASSDIPCEFNCEHYYMGDTQFDLDGDGSDEDPYYCPSVDFQDGTDFKSETPFYTDKATYRRTKYAMWSLLCLPYAIAADDNADCEFYEIASQSDDQVTLTKITGKIEAGRPVILRQLTNGEPVVISASGDEIYVSNTTSEDPASMMQGSFEETVAPKGSYVISDGKFCLVDDLSSDDVKVGAFQGYITADAFSSKATTLNIVIDNMNSIEKLNAIMDNANAEYYDIEGHRLDGLQKGLNIIKNGNKTMKVIIK